jgi:hypothetical protein
MSRIVTITAAIEIELPYETMLYQLQEELPYLLHGGLRSELPKSPYRVSVLAVDDELGILTKPLDVKRLLDRQRQVAVIWEVDDVLVLRPELTDDQAWEALQHAHKYYDAELGFNWEFIASVAEALFGPEPQRASS